MSKAIVKTKNGNLSPYFIEGVEKLKKDLYDHQRKMSSLKTPKEKIEKRGKFNYVKDDYLRDKMDKYFPGWSWIECGSSPVQIVGVYWVIISGKLKVPDFGIITPNGAIFYREFFSPAAHRIQYPSVNPGQTKEYNPPDIVDLGNDVKAANTDALKKAINMLTHIADDVYGKEMSEDLSNELQEKILSLVHQLKTEEERDEVRNYIDNFGGIECLSELNAKNLISNMDSVISK